MDLNDNKKVWAPDGREGFCLGKVVDIGTDAITVELVNGKNVSAPYKRVFSSEDDNNKDHDDNCALMYLNEATLLNNIKIRYKTDKIYTYVANILIALNPYHELAGLYSKQSIEIYKGKSLGMLPPHVYAIADKTYRDMKVLKQSQSIIVSGESGAGKTESTKYILRYLTEAYGHGGVGNIEKRIVEANPLLEAFGNAKTLRNLNSSRFGKYVEVHFNNKPELAGAFISHYLLEKSRIVRQSAGERNYHVFYRMCAGAPSDMKSALRLSDAKTFNYLNRGSLSERGIDDVRDFQMLDNAMNAVGLSTADKSNIYRIAAAVLHLGNINFQESTKDKKGGSELSPASETSAAITAKLLGLHQNELAMSLTTRIMMTAKGGGMGTMYKIPLSPAQAAAGRDALAKSIYSNLFDHIVSCINKCFPFKDSANYIGVLDIAGFEFFEVNSFEQLCINYCNEKLQQFFNQRILKEEQALYEKEGLGVKTVNYADNQDCIDLFEMKATGLFDLLDEEMKFPSPSETHFTTELHSKNNKHFRLAIPRKSPLSIHRSVRDDQGFLVRHFAGAVCYQTVEFLEKNNDALHDSLEQLVLESSDPFLKSLFPAPKPQANSKPGGKVKKLTFDSVGKKFRRQLDLLLEKLRSTGSNFIRCIKPNDQMKSRDFEGAQILSQLQCAGMVSVLELMQEGYPSRTAFLDLHTKYKSFLPPKLAKLDPRTFCNALFRAVGMDNDDFKFGMTKVFFRPGKFAEFDQIMRSDPQALNALISKVNKWIIRNRWKRATWCALSVQKLANKIKFRREMLVRIQKTVKMFINVRKHKPRYKGLIKMRTLEVQVNQMSSLVSVLKKDKDKFNKEVMKLKENVQKAIQQIKQSMMKQGAIDKLYDSLVKEINKQLNSLKSQKAAQEEQERLRKIQEQMEMEKRKREEEEKKRLQEDRQMKERAAKEAKMKKEAADQKRKAEEEKVQASMEKAKKEEDQKNLEISQREEQEQRDYELALRLAADPQTMVSDERVQLKRNIATTDAKYEKIRKWTYAELRDVINTSCDLDMLEACRVEYHRRLKVYHAWRKRNMEKNKNAPKAQRAPVELIRQAELSAATTTFSSKSSKTNNNAQRYFRVPFSKPTDQYRDREYTKSGWWYAHFDGNYIARQLEIHPNGALLLLAGKNDEEICELSLTETRLESRSGAEITVDEFNDVWTSYGGKIEVFKSKQQQRK
ncbi:unconventional myosin-VI-like [Clytia hemisphaerica]|uniref:Unconventional myosin-VI n=1 Tax=Clytia hemisphaerica TaxID=252671 RepID=A0A7M5TRN7_9CNID